MVIKKYKLNSYPNLMANQNNKEINGSFIAS